MSSAFHKACKQWNTKDVNAPQHGWQACQAKESQKAQELHKGKDFVAAGDGKGDDEYEQRQRRQQVNPKRAVPNVMVRNLWW